MILRLFLSITLILTLPSRSQWGDYNTEKILSHVSAIVLADFQSSSNENGYQVGIFKITEILKGRKAKVGEEIHLWGYHDLVVGPVVKFEELKKSSHLLLIYYLGRAPDGKRLITGSPANGTSSVLPITNGKVPWPREFIHNAKEFPTDLDKVKKQISVVAKAEADAYAKGVAKAKSELKKGELNYNFQTNIYTRAADALFVSKAKKKYGITVRIQTHTLYDAVDREEHEGFNDTIIAHLKKKLGYNPIPKLRGFGLRHLNDK